MFSKRFATTVLVASLLAGVRPTTQHQDPPNIVGGVAHNGDHHSRPEWPHHGQRAAEHPDFHRPSLQCHYH